MRYYYNKHVDEHGYHEVHTEDCIFLPLPENRIYIGDFFVCSEALEAAKLENPDLVFDGCFCCCNSCHKG